MMAYEITSPQPIDKIHKPNTVSNDVIKRDISISPYQDFYVVKMLNKAKFPVYLVCSRVNKQHYAMKVFPRDNGKLNKCFANEIRFTHLDHPSLIKIEHVETDKTIFSKGCARQMSYTLMEYAPYGDLYEWVNSSKIPKENKLIRTYFKQLIEGLEYLHNHGIAHLDIKLENLLFGEDYSLKIADFDLSYIIGDNLILAKGTKCYRAPELIRAKCKNYSAVDIYSAGIILFILKSGGIMPHCEDALINGFNLYELLNVNNDLFWEKHCEFQKKAQNEFEPEFRELFIAMTRQEPEKRANIQEIKNSKWYKGETYTAEELKEIMNKYP